MRNGQEPPVTRERGKVPGIKGRRQQVRALIWRTADFRLPATDGLPGAVYVPPRHSTYICALPLRKLVSFPPSFLCARITLWVMAISSITDPLTIVRTSKEVLLCFFGVYWSVLDLFEICGY